MKFPVKLALIESEDRDPIKLENKQHTQTPEIGSEISSQLKCSEENQSFHQKDCVAPKKEDQLNNFIIQKLERDSNLRRRTKKRLEEATVSEQVLFVESQKDYSESPAKRKSSQPNKMYYNFGKNFDVQASGNNSPGSSKMKRNLGSSYDSPMDLTQAANKTQITMNSLKFENNSGTSS